MSRQIKDGVLVAITVGVVMSCSTPALAAKKVIMTERYKNTTNPATTAKCIRKYLDGYTVKSARSDKFATCTPTAVGAGKVRIECSGTDLAHTGEVTAGQKATVKFRGTAGTGAKVLSAKWYSDAACTTFIGYTKAVATATVTTASVNMVLENWAREWNDETGEPGDPLGAVYGSHVYYAVSDYPRPLEEVSEDLWTCHNGDVPIPGVACVTNSDCSPGTCGPPPGLTWEDPDPSAGPTTFELPAYGDSVTYDLGAIEGTSAVLFRFYTELEPTHGDSDFELLQFCPGECIPAVSEWGLVVVALLLAAGGTIVIRRRRAIGT